MRRPSSYWELLTLILAALGGLFLLLFWRWFERAAPLVCWIVIVAASTISDLLILW